MQIKKFTDLELGQSFMQVNLIEGYKYVDRAGEIVNYFHSDNKPPRFDMNLNGLVIFNPESSVQQFKVSSVNTWASFLRPASLEVMESFFVRCNVDVLNIIEVETVNRVGWRHNLVHAFKNEAERDQCFKKFGGIANTNVEDITLRSKIENTSLTLRLKQIVSKDDKPYPGILLDADFYQDYSVPVKTERVSTALAEFKKNIRSDTFLDLVNKIISIDNG